MCVCVCVYICVCMSADISCKYGDVYSICVYIHIGKELGR